MDPVSAIGIASAAVQFIDFSLKTLEICKQIRDNADGATEANKELEKASRELKGLQDELKTKTLSRRITTISKDCLSTADELIQVLEQVRGAGRAKPLSAARATLRVLKQRRTLEKLQNKLRSKKEVLDTALINDIRNRVDLAAVEQSKQFATLDLHVQQLIQSLRSQQQALANDHVDILTRVTELKTEHKATQAQIISSQATIERNLKSLDRSLEDGLERVRLSDAREQLLNSLFYPAHEQRRETIKPPWQNTFDWIFARQTDEGSSADAGSLFEEDLSVEETHPWPSLMEWLEHGSGTYWVCGKAGSGKSTLMAHIFHETRTRTSLEVWSAGSPLHIISFFFWRPGIELQKSVVGLLRSLLYQICEKDDRIAGALLFKWQLPVGRIPEWTESKLASMIGDALQIAKDSKFCLFLDGLDEFEGDYNQLVDLVLALQQMTNLKACVSSRPDICLLDRLKDCQQLRLETLNRADLTAFVKGRFQHHGISEEKLSGEILDKAEGVFLWTALVTQSIIQGFQDGDSTELLMERLRRMPRGIESFFAHMLAKVDDVHLQRLAFWVKLANSMPRDPTGVSVLLIAIMTFDKKRCSYKELLEHCKRIDRQMIAQTKGLIYAEIIPGNSTFPEATRVWSVRTTVENDSLGIGLNVRSQVASQRTLVEVDAIEEELLRYERHFLAWVHRSAYDFILESEAASRIRTTLNSVSEVEIYSRHVDAQISLMRYAPSLEDSCRTGMPSLHSLPLRALLLIKIYEKCKPGIDVNYHDKIDKVQTAVAKFPLDEILPRGCEHRNCFSHWYECLVPDVPLTTRSAQEVWHVLTYRDYPSWNKAAWHLWVRNSSARMLYWRWCAFLGAFRQLDFRLDTLKLHDDRAMVYSAVLRPTLYRWIAHGLQATQQLLNLIASLLDKIQSELNTKAYGQPIHRYHSLRLRDFTRYAYVKDRGDDLPSYRISWLGPDLSSRHGWEMNFVLGDLFVSWMSWLFIKQRQHRPGSSAHLPEFQRIDAGFLDLLKEAEPFLELQLDHTPTTVDVPRRRTVWEVPLTECARCMDLIDEPSATHIDTEMRLACYKYPEPISVPGFNVPYRCGELVASYRFCKSVSYAAVVDLFKCALYATWKTDIHKIPSENEKARYFDEMRENIWLDRDGQLDAFSQLYVLACIRRAALPSGDLASSEEQMIFNICKAFIGMRDYSSSHEEVISLG